MGQYSPLVSIILLINGLLGCVHGKECSTIPEDIGKGYQVLPGEFTPDTAIHECETYGGRLAKIRSISEQEAAVDALLKVRREKRNAWFDLLVNGELGMHYHDRSKASDFEKWGPDAATVYQSNKVCASIGNYTINPGLWSLGGCDKRISALCQFPKLPEGYKYFIAETSDKISFPDAQKLCNDRGATFAYFTDDSEYVPLKSAVAKSKKNYFFAYTNEGADEWKTSSGAKVNNLHIFESKQGVGCAANKDGSHMLVSMDCNSKVGDGALCKRKESPTIAGKKEFFVVNKPGIYIHLSAACSENGGFIAEINSQEDQMKALQAMSKVSTYFNLFYFRSMKMTQDKKPVWGNGKAVTFQQFYRDPSAILPANKKFCPLIAYNARHQGSWYYSHDCSREATGVLCTKSAGSTNVDVETRFNFGKTKKYEVVEEQGPMNYYEWQDFCQKKGGYFATVDNAKDLESLKEALKGVTTPAIIGVKRSATKKNVFLNPGGQSLKFSNWQSDQGDDISLDCVSVIPSSGLWLKNQKCASQVGVCEIKSEPEDAGETMERPVVSTEGVTKRYSVLRMTTMKDFNSLRQECKKMNAEIANIMNKHENEAARQSLESHGVSRALIGAQKSGNSFRWVPSNTWSYENFNSKIDNDPCLEMSMSTGKWYTIDCRHTAVVCEVSKNAVQQTGKTKSFSVEKKYSRKNKAYFQTKCGSALATIFNAEENKKVHDLVKSISFIKTIPLAASGRTLADFKWDDGSLVKSRSYQNWKAGTNHFNPSNTMKCLEMETKTGKWQTAPCTNKYKGAVCMK